MVYLVGMVINVAKGIAGTQYGARPVPLADVDTDDLEAVAKDWLNAAFDEFGPLIANRESYIVSSPPVLSAIGAMGNRILLEPASSRAGLLSRQIADLSTVNWRKGEHWDGIAGKVTAGGKFAVGGTKEVAYAVYLALATPGNRGYRAVRGLDAPAGSQPATALTAP